MWRPRWKLLASSKHDLKLPFDLETWLGGTNRRRRGSCTPMRLPLAGPKDASRCQASDPASTSDTGEGSDSPRAARLIRAALRAPLLNPAAEPTATQIRTGSGAVHRAGTIADDA
jgi:hypothetical protein